MSLRHDTTTAIDGIVFFPLFGPAVKTRFSNLTSILPDALTDTSASPMPQGRPGPLMPRMLPAGPVMVAGTPIILSDLNFSRCLWRGLWS